jgi:hypothetical protein
VLQALEEREQAEEWAALALDEGETDGRYGAVDGQHESAKIEPGDLLVSVNGYDVSTLVLREISEVIKSQPFPIVLGFIHPQYQFGTSHGETVAAAAAAAGATGATNGAGGEALAVGLDASVLRAADVGSGYAFTTLPVNNRTLQRVHGEATAAVEESAHLHTKKKKAGATKEELQVQCYILHILPILNPIRIISLCRCRTTRCSPAGCTVCCRMYSRTSTCALTKVRPTDIVYPQYYPY